MVVILGIVFFVAACGTQTNSPTVTNSRIGQPTGPSAALYFTASGYRTADSLVSASTPVAARVEIHETITSDTGTMSMEQLSSLPLPAEGELVLEPGSFHLMLVDVDRLEVGAEVDVTLVWEIAGSHTIKVEVVDPADTVDHEMGTSG